MRELSEKNIREEVLAFLLNALDLDIFGDILDLKGPEYMVFKL
jgi:hypothetical protein